MLKGGLDRAAQTRERYTVGIKDPAEGPGTRDLLRGLLLSHTRFNKAIAGAVRKRMGLSTKTTIISEVT